MTSPCSVIRIRPRSEPRGWARIARCVRPPPRDGEPPRPWKSSSSSPASARLGGEPLLRGVQRPLAGDEARVLARVRVAEHDQLAVAERAQRVAVDGRVVEHAHRLGRVAQVGERLEQRPEPQLRARAPRQPQRGEHVGRPLDHRDDHHRHGALAVRLARERDRVEHAQQLAGGALGAAGEPAAALADRLLQQPPPLALVRVAVAGQQRRDRLLDHRGRLAHVERGDVEAEDVDLPQQPPDRAVGDVRRSRRCRARARGRRAAPAGRRSRARARAGRACCRAGG